MRRLSMDSMLQLLQRKLHTWMPDSIHISLYRDVSRSGCSIIHHRNRIRMYTEAIRDPLHQQLMG